MEKVLKVQQLLQKMLESGGTPEEVCAESPELLPAVLEQWAQIRRLAAEIEELFPSCGSKLIDQFNRANDEQAGLPQIPGYEVESVLGHGGMGIVYKARHVRLNRTIALKMLLSGAYASKLERARFLREAQAVAALRHANVVQVHDVGEFEGRPFFTMEFVEGMTLAQRLASAPQPPFFAAEMLATLALAVESAHQSEIVHRDLKPSNILLTEDGIPKISDFGLARRFEDDDALTVSGARMGTPSYMAPEQVFSRTGTVGPPADIYSLGAILYEMLTGRPPFRGESAAETERQLMTDDPPPPSRLNAQVARDLETICLKCLQKDPQRRYATASAFAEDLRRFQRGEPILARQTSGMERAVKWARRRPAVAIAMAGAIAVTIAMAGGTVWVISTRAANARAVNQDLKEAVGFQKQSNWTEARAAMDRAALRLGDHGPTYLYNRLNQAKLDSQLAAKLDGIEMNHIRLVADPETNQQAYDEYAKVFRSVGLVTEQDDLQVAAARIRNSNVCPAILAAIENWMFCANTEEQTNWLLDLTNRIDKGQDPSGWRDRVRAAWSVNDGGRGLMALALSARFADQPAPFLLAIESRLRQLGMDTAPYMTRVLAAYPSDYWTNVTMGYVMWNKKDDMPQAIRYYQAAMALRPEVPSAHYCLGTVLSYAGRNDESNAEFREVIRLEPGYAYSHAILAACWTRLGDYNRAIVEAEAATHETPKYAQLYYLLGVIYNLSDRYEEAVEPLRHALMLQPKQPLAQTELIYAMLHSARPSAEIIAAWKAETKVSPTVPEVIDGYAEYCLFVGQESEYRSARRDLLDNFKNGTDPRTCERIGRACLLLPASEVELKEATALIDRAVSAGKSSKSIYYPYFRFAKAMAEYQAGHYESTISICNDVGNILGPAPHLLLAMAHCRQGQLDLAKDALMKAVLIYDWNAVNANNREAWLYHSLRRQAEGMILTNMPAFLRGDYQPKDNVERLAFTAICQFRNLNSTGAQLWADAFAEDPTLESEHGYDAARFAALAGCGSGDDASRLSKVDRTRLRKQARDWLLAELASCEIKLANGSAVKQSIQATLSTWTTQRDLAGIRDPALIAQLPAAEQADCLALWKRHKTIVDRASQADMP